MSQKLKANDDHYPTEDSKIAYATSRLGGDAAAHTIKRMRMGSDNPYTTSKEIFDQLDDIYQDSDRKGNAKRQYDAIEQGTRPFIEFYSDFIRVGAILKKSSDDLLDELPKKLAKRLKDFYYGKGGCSSIREAKEYLLKLDNHQRSEYQL